MPPIISAFASGLLFGLGLIVSRMVDPAKVLGFLDLFGDWDPSLAFVMAAGVMVSALGFLIVRRRGLPLLAPCLEIPTRRDLDPRLIGGAALFGIGWGLAGLCPGPALVALMFAPREIFAFVAAMVAGMVLFRLAAEAPRVGARRQAASPGRVAGRLRRGAAAPLPRALLSSHGGTVVMSPETSPLHGRPIVKGFYEKRTGSVQYVVADPQTKRCAIIDPVLDFDPKSGATATVSADELLAHVEREGYTLEWILDTHPHADHFSAAGYLKDRTGVPTAIGEKVVEVQKLWKGIYNWPDSFPTDGSQWDRLFADGERFKIGDMDVEVMFTPGHTLASIAYVMSDAAFIHDTLFMPDGGTARTDFPGGSARALWRSIQRILALPDDTRLFTGHDYMPGGREPRWEVTVAQERRENKHLREAKTEEEFVALREARDRALPLPRLILHALQVNIRGGRLPEPESNGRRYLKIPLDALDSAPWDD